MYSMRSRRRVYTGRSREAGIYWEEQGRVHLQQEEQGRVHIQQEEQGGSAIYHQEEQGGSAIYHPGTSCCPGVHLPGPSCSSTVLISFLVGGFVKVSSVLDADDPRSPASPSFSIPSPVQLREIRTFARCIHSGHNEAMTPGRVVGGHHEAMTPLLLLLLYIGVHGACMPGYGRRYVGARVGRRLPASF